MQVIRNTDTDQNGAPRNRDWCSDCFAEPDLLLEVTVSDSKACIYLCKICLGIGTQILDVYERETVI